MVNPAGESSELDDTLGLSTMAGSTLVTWISDDSSP